MQKSQCADQKVRRLSVDFSTEVFSLGAIKKAAYRFSDRAAFDFARDGESITVRLELLSELPLAEAEALVSAFRNEVLDQDLRETVAEETSAVRNAVLAYAFSRTGLQGE